MNVVYIIIHLNHHIHVTEIKSHMSARMLLYVAAIKSPFSGRSK